MAIFVSGLGNLGSGPPAWWMQGGDADVSAFASYARDAGLSGDTIEAALEEAAFDLGWAGEPMPKTILRLGKKYSVPVEKLYAEGKASR